MTELEISEVNLKTAIKNYLINTLNKGDFSYSSKHVKKIEDKILQDIDQTLNLAIFVMSNNS
jgi:hypothetical protein